MPLTLLQRIIDLASYLPTPETEEKIRHAFEFAWRAHLGQKRYSGDDYITHPLHAALHLMDLKPDIATIQATLLHDVLEDTSVTLDQVQKEFDAEVVGLLVSFTSIRKIRYQGKEENIENMRKLFMAIAQDHRLALIKFSERLHNLETIEYYPVPEERRRIALETLNVYAPIAARLGIYSMKDKLERFSFQIAYPDEYADITQQLDVKSLERDTFLNSAITQVKTVLLNGGISAEVSGRIKSSYSIFKKMEQKARASIDELYDIFALRVLVPDKSDCYAALGVIHNRFVPLSGRFKDYIAVPKPNNYQSLHTTVIGIGHQLRHEPTEIQIRTHVMHQEAEYGVAAHHLYKEHGSELSALSPAFSLAQRESVYEFHQVSSSSSVNEYIYVLTPKGDIKELPKGSTPVDFAYVIHTDLGHRVKGARVDNGIVPLDYQLQNGDIVEILTKNTLGPNEYWLSFVKTHVARSKIKAWFFLQNQDEMIYQGKQMLNEQLIALGRPVLDADFSLLRHYDDRDLSLTDRTDLLERIGNGSITVSSVVKKLFGVGKKVRPSAAASKGFMTVRKTLLVAGEPWAHFHLAACCAPREPQAIVGYVTRGKSMSIHRPDCRILQGLDQSRILPAAWKKPAVTLRLQVILSDSNKILRELLACLDTIDVELEDMTLEKSPEGGECFIVCQVSEKIFARFEDLKKKFSENKSVKKVEVEK